MTVLGILDELDVLVARLRVAVTENGGDRDSQVREVTRRMHRALFDLKRHLMRDTLYDPAQASRFLARTFLCEPTVDIAELHENDPARMTIVAQIVFELLESMTTLDTRLWFDAPMPQLGGRTPRELLDESPEIHGPALLTAARGGRAQDDRSD